MIISVCQSHRHYPIRSHNERRISAAGYAKTLRSVSGVKFSLKLQIGYI